MKRLLIALCLLMSSAFAQTKYFTTTIDVTNSPYGMMAQIFNHGATTIYIDEVDVSVGLFTDLVSHCTTEPTDPGQACGYLVQGIALSMLEESNCTTQPIYWEDWSMGQSFVATSGNTLVRASSQPCTPHGLSYGIPYTGYGNCNGYNYSCITTAPLKRCRGEACVLHYAVARAILPNTGISVWTARYRLDGLAFGWIGIGSVNFKWHE